MKERANSIIFSFLSCKHFYICGCNRVHQKGQRNYMSGLIFLGGLIDCFGNFHSRNFLALLNYKNTFPFIGSCASVRLADNIKNTDAFSGWCMTSKRSHDLCTIMQLLRYCSGMIIIVP